MAREITKSALNPQASEPVFYEDPRFIADGVRHGFFGRRGGVSAGIYASLNCGQGSDDDPGNVSQNREIVREALSAQHLLSVHQVHGAVCLPVSGPWEGERPKADALVTDTPGVGLGILTADCGPVLFAGEKEGGAPVVAVAHAGWGGAFCGILESTVTAMQELGVLAESIKACVGPCIAQSSYEVGAEFLERFIEADEANEFFFKESRKDGRFLFDLPGYIAARLAKAGVKNVVLTDIDTYAREDEYFSYRRTTHRGEPDYGRQVSAIVIASPV